MDEEPADEPYANGFHTADAQWFVLLRQTRMDRWGEDERKAMRANLQWVSRHRANEGARRRLQLTLIAGAFTIAAACISWIAPWKATAPICPSGYVCTQTPVASPTP